MADVTVNFGPFDDGAARYARAAGKSLLTWGFETERRAKILSAVDTGFNANSVYTVGDGGMWSNGMHIATRPGLPVGPSRKHPGRKKYRAGQFAEQAPIDGSGEYPKTLRQIVSGTVVVTMSGGPMTAGPTVQAPDTLWVETRVGSLYGIFLEMGTIRTRPQPFLGPAAEQTTPMLDPLLQKNLRLEGL